MSLIHEVSDIFQNQKFPKKWITIELNKVLKIQNGFAFKSSNFNSDGIGMPLIRIRDIKNSTMETFYDGIILEDFIVTEGDLIIGMDGDFNSNFWKGSPALLNQRVCRLIPDENFILKKLLYYGLPNYLNKINENTSSTTVKHLSSKSIGEIPFPLPPLAEQNRIVTKLDTLFAQLETIKASMAKIPVLLKEFRQQVLTQAVTGKLTEEWRKGKELGEWNNVLLNDICSSITDGDHQAPPQVNEGIPFLVISNVSKGYFEFDKVSRFVPKEYYNSLKDTRKPRKGDVLYTVTGSYGIPLLVDFNKKFCFQRHIAILRPDVNKVSSNFLKIILQSDLILHQSHNVATGTAQLTVPLGGIKKFEIDLPILNEQQEIVSRVESLFAKADAIEQQYLSVKEKIDTLPQALLHKAFKGELTEQLESDGDARELLQQIQELKNSTVKPKKATSKKVKKYPENETVLGMVAEGK